MTALKRLLRHLRPYWRGLTITTVLILAKTLVALLPPLFTRSVIDDVIGKGQMTLLLPLMGGLVAVYLVVAFTDFGDQFLRHTIGEKILTTCGCGSTTTCSGSPSPSSSAPPPAS
jgi:ABC-type bacteriocin/lantibiotic exporter with double-glycine peptidase domain